MMREIISVEAGIVQKGNRFDVFGVSFFSCSSPSYSSCSIYIFLLQGCYVLIGTILILWHAQATVKSILCRTQRFIWCDPPLNISAKISQLLCTKIDCPFCYIVFNPCKLLLSGDVEVNPGPRPARPQNSKKGFQKKRPSYSLSTQIVDDYLNSYTIRNYPVGLENFSNICFMNAVTQTLYFLPGKFHEDVNNFQPHPDMLPKERDIALSLVNTLKSLFQEISTTTSAVKTCNYFTGLRRYQHWKLGEQQDAQEYLDFVLNNIYFKLNPTISCPFKLGITNNITCSACGTVSTNKEFALSFPLEMETNTSNTIQQLLDKAVIGENISCFTCSNCQTNGQALKFRIINSVSDFLILHLKLFTYDRAGNEYKITPNLQIEENLNYFNFSFQLYGIIYHSGMWNNQGHYIAGVNANQKWFTISDTVMNRNKLLSCTSNDYTTPYIIFYRKQSSIQLSTDVSKQTATTSQFSGQSCSSGKNTIISNDEVREVSPEKLYKTDANPSENENLMRREFKQNVSEAIENLTKVVSDADKSNLSENLTTTKNRVINELFKQTENIINIKEKQCAKLPATKKGIKRKSIFSHKNKKEINEKRRQDYSNMPKDKKDKLNENQRKAKKRQYDNMTEDKKSKLNEKKRITEKVKYDNLPEDKKSKLNE